MIPMLSLLLGSGIVGSIAITYLGQYINSRHIALFFSSLAIVIWVMITQQINFQDTSLQLLESYRWIDALNIRFTLGIDGLSYLFVTLTLVVNLIVILSTYWLDYEDMSFYLALFLFMQSMVAGVFLTFDAIAFYLFWEGMLIPMYLCIGMFGSSLRSKAATKFFLYTFIGSLCMLIGLVYMGLSAQSFSFLAMQDLALTLTEQKWLFLALLFAFAVKVPMFPLHTWLPDAHTEAPQSGSVILAALMLKVGAYGLMRLSLPLLPDASQYFANFMITLSLIAILYVGVVAYSQRDIKRLIAYSSVAHMGFVTLGIFLTFGASSIDTASFGYMGAVIQMVAHAFGSGALFLAFGWLYQRYPIREIDQYRGLATQLPKFSMFFLLYVFSTIGVPLTAGFVGEWMVIVSAIAYSPLLGGVCALTIVISSIYLLSMFRSVFFGEPTEAITSLRDIDGYAYGVLLLVAILILLIGIYPQLIIEVCGESVRKLTAVAMISKVSI